MDANQNDVSENDLLNLISHSDLAPGETKARLYDPGKLDVRFIRNSTDPLFEAAYEHLWRQFGSAAEMEVRSVIDRRFAWDPAKPTGDARLLYEMILVRDRAGKFVGVRDHTAILRTDAPSPIVVVHLSHLLIAPSHRGTGLAGWMRAWPLATAGACAAAAGVAGDVPTVLVGEMEHPDTERSAETMSRLIAYEKAGYLKVDTHAVDYWQPDFREPAAIDKDQVRPIPMGLIVRRVGRENELVISGREVRRLIAAVYDMYADGFRAKDMRVVYDHMATLPADDAQVALVPPTK